MLGIKQRLSSPSPQPGQGQAELIKRPHCLGSPQTTASQLWKKRLFRQGWFPDHVDGYVHYPAVAHGCVQAHCAPLEG